MGLAKCNRLSMRQSGIDTKVQRYVVKDTVGVQRVAAHDYYFGDPVPWSMYERNLDDHSEAKPPCLCSFGA